ncbi:hypothetical protein M0Q28_03315 [Patescibacteria group bacterium]|jgi:hypothetical protein|nr:hypothetical protein [Patescibacteria group bacterium]
MTNLISIGDLISKGFKAIQDTWKPTLKYTVWFFLAPILLGSVMMFGAFSLGSARGSVGPIIFTLMLVAYIALIVVLLWASISIMQYMLAYAHGHADAAPKRSALSYVPSLLWVGILSCIPLFLSWILVVIPRLVLRNDTAAGLFTALFVLGVIAFNIWFGIAVSQSSLLVIDEVGRGIAALKESYAMVLNRWWKTLWRLVIPNFLFQMIVSTILMVIYMVAFFIGIAVFGGWTAAIGMDGTDALRATNVGFSLLGTILIVIFGLVMIAFTAVATVAQMLFQTSVSAELYLSLKHSKHGTQSK